MARYLIDCDGVLADFVGHLLGELAARGLPVPGTLTGYEVFDQLTERSAEEAKHILKSGEFWATMPRFEEATPAIAALKAANHDIYVVTSPWYSCMEWEFARRAWLTRNFELRPKRMISTSDKHHIHGDVFVDDKPAHVRDWQKAWPQGRAFLMDRPWSAGEEVPCPRINWDPAGVEALLSAAHASS